MKKMALVLAGVLTLGGLTACGNIATTEPEADDSQAAVEQTADTEAADDQAADAEAQPADQAAAPVAGGWTLNMDANLDAMPQELATATSAAFADLVGASYEPVAYLGSQVVAGTNYQVLCRQTLTTAQPTTAYKVAIIYADLDGNYTVTKVADFDLGELAATDDAAAGEAGLAGGWTVNEDVAKGTNLDADAKAIFEKAVDGLAGVGYEPAAMLGSQVVAGANYAYLCKATTVTAKPVSYLAMVFVYNDLDGNATISNIVPLDLADFNK